MPPGPVSVSASSQQRPFERLDRNATGWALRAQLLLAAVTLVPVRLAFALALFTWYFCTIQALSWLGCSRETLRAVTRPGSRLLLVVLGFWTIEERNKPRRGAILPSMVISNHVSVLEVVYFMSSAACPSFLMKLTCMQVPVIGSMAVKLGGILVDRENRGGGGATEALLARVAQLREDKEHGRPVQPVLCFPEGTTSNGKYLMPFRSGAFRAGVPVLPVMVEFPFSGSQFSCAYEAVSTPVFIFRLLAQWRHRMRVTYMDTYEPTPEEVRDPRLYAANVRAAMAERIGLGLTDQDYDDKLEYHLSLRKHFERLGPRSLYMYVRPDLVASPVPRKPKDL